jgi:hypothetical protein
VPRPLWFDRAKLSSNNGFTIATLPAKNVVALAFPIVTPVAVEVPIEIVPVASMMTLELPEMLVPLKVSAATAIEAPTKMIGTHSKVPRITSHRVGTF